MQSCHELWTMTLSQRWSKSWSKVVLQNWSLTWAQYPVFAFQLETEWESLRWFFFFLFFTVL